MGLHRLISLNLGYLTGNSTTLFPTGIIEEPASPQALGSERYTGLAYLPSLGFQQGWAGLSGVPLLFFALCCCGEHCDLKAT